MPKKPDIQALLEQSRRKRGAEGSCWRQRLGHLSGPALDYIEAVEDELEDHTGQGISNVLKSLGFPIGRSAVAAHYKGDCSCPKSTTS